MRNYPNINELFPWVSSLPVEDKLTFDKEIKESLVHCVSVGDYSSFAVLLNEWQNTAEIWEDEDLAESLLRPINEE